MNHDYEGTGGLPLRKSGDRAYLMYNYRPEIWHSVQVNFQNKPLIKKHGKLRPHKEISPE